ncbi:hypothetical protein PMIN06_007974 [Paraphaeosphaeria minitans]
MPIEHTTELLCSHCSKTFKHKSSLVRHTHRCVQNLEAPSRQKSCGQCIVAKARCDLQRPQCGRCLSRGVQCEFEPVGGAQAPRLNNEVMTPAEHQQLHEGEEVSACSPRNISTTIVPISLPESTSTRTGSILKSFPYESGLHPPRSWFDTQEDVAPEVIASRQRSQLLLGTPHGTLSTSAVAHHAMFHVVRVLRSWPRMMARYGLGSFQLPPIIHHIQLKEGLPISFLSGIALSKMWLESEGRDRDVAYHLTLKEVNTWLREYQSYSELDLLATTQSLLLLMIVLFLGDVPNPLMPHPTDAELIVSMWNVKHHVARTCLLLDEEMNHGVPSWKKWAIVSAKRRTILALHHLEWAWSLLHGYPPLAYSELGPLPAPAAGYLWRERSEKEWKRQYHEWLSRWEGGGYKLGELFHIKPGGEMDTRSEMWLAEVDEFGMMVMFEGTQLTLVIVQLTHLYSQRSQ